MSTKEEKPKDTKEKPTLAGVNVKTRKRNIIIPEDPGSFANAVVALVNDAAEGVSLEADLEAGAKALDTAELEFSRYGDVLFECWFAGGRVSTGPNLQDENAPRLTHTVLACPPEREAMVPYFKVFQNLTRRRPFLIRGLENTLIKFLLSLEFFDDLGRRKLGIALALTFTMKIGVLPENIFASLRNDRLVAKGTVLELLTVFFKEFLSKDSVDDLVQLLTKAKMANRLPDFAPPNKKTVPELHAYFKENNLDVLVEWDIHRELQNRLGELEQALYDALVADPPMSAADCLVLVKSKKAESNIPDTDVLRVVWSALMKSINLTGKNQQQIVQTILTKIKTHHKLLSTNATATKTELALLNAIQVYFYEDSRLLKCFADTVKILYNADIVGEDTIQLWYKKGSHAKGRAVFIKDMEPFIKWLEEAEEEGEDA